MVLLKVSTQESNKVRQELPGCFDETDNLNEVQLWSSRGPHYLSRLRGKHVRVTGMLSARDGPPAELRAAQMWVSKVSLVALVPNNSIQRTPARVAGGRR
jgi:hypothetical protein